jgi:hypothetical protein
MEESFVSMREHIHNHEAWDAGKLTTYSHTPKAFHIDALSSKSVADARGHSTSSNDIAANAFGAVECTGVLRQADEAVLARCVCSACDGKVSANKYIPKRCKSEVAYRK